MPVDGLFTGHEIPFLVIPSDRLVIHPPYHERRSPEHSVFPVTSNPGNQQVGVKEQGGTINEFTDTRDKKRFFFPYPPPTVCAGPRNVKPSPTPLGSDAPPTVPRALSIYFCGQTAVGQAVVYFFWGYSVFIVHLGLNALPDEIHRNLR